MAWNTPKTWGYKETLSSSDMNTYIRDNLNALRDGSALNITWQSFTPTFAWSVGSIVNGNATISGKYFQLGKFVFYKIKYILGSTTSWAGCSGYFTFTLPVTSVALYVQYPRMGHGSMFDANGIVYPAVGIQRTVTTCSIERLDASGVSSYDNDISTTTPFTWAPGDEIYMEGFYEVP